MNATQIQLSHLFRNQLSAFSCFLWIPRVTLAHQRPSESIMCVICNVYVHSIWWRSFSGGCWHNYLLIILQNTYDFFLLKTAPTECIVNTKLSESNRASGVLRRSVLLCDQRNLKTIGKWHQFVGDAGNKMPNSCVPTQRCGTHAPGWMNGEHPKKEDGVVNREVCFHWSNNCCRWKVTIKVRNCGGHYVYKLEKPPACYLRFCGDKGHSKFLIDGRDSGF